MWEIVYKNLLLVYILELGAALAGSYYLKKIKGVKKETKILVYYLWLVIFVESVGLYPLYAYFTNYETMPFIKDTPWERNYWWYNLYHFLKFAALFYYFVSQLSSAVKRKIFRIVAVIYLLCSILYLSFSGEFFYQYSTFDSIVGTFFIITLILFYLYELLKSEQILNFYKSLPFYISIGILVWHVTVTPLLIYSMYFTQRSPEFVELNTIVLRLINIFLYGMFIAGFLICATKKKEIEKLKRV
ncbi:hypothetical protein LZ575_22060 [Antarcticibacterium sp. 1MA-6-2]|uniref:hypothetical protein n=1 Tax=Antarcticibacterium sp. 1MA-6-2 TaxID=2908210 RepID=UPI001F213A10|nr:hypothetical protein [Antarcticibacterium sp. 1MA-6-2]UJH91235.1 hypothetical protein LZ575_22060 [Antarcticibacterium sp. 1MA-6-2]